MGGPAVIALTPGQRNALVALRDAADRSRSAVAFARPTGVQDRTLFKLEELGLARTRTFISGTTARITPAGRRALES